MAVSVVVATMTAVLLTTVLLAAVPLPTMLPLSPHAPLPSRGRWST